MQKQLYGAILRVTHMQRTAKQQSHTACKAKFSAIWDPSPCVCFGGGGGVADKRARSQIFITKGIGGKHILMADAPVRSRPCLQLLVDHMASCWDCTPETRVQGDQSCRVLHGLL